MESSPQIFNGHRPRRHAVAGRHRRRDARRMSARHALRAHADGAGGLARGRQAAAGDEEPIDFFRNQRAVGDIVIAAVADKQMLPHVGLR